MSLYTQFAHAQDAARRRASRSSVDTPSAPPDYATALAASSHSFAGAGEAQLRTASLMTASTASLMRLGQDPAGGAEPPLSPPSSAASGAAVAASMPTHEYYGFVVYLVSLATFAVYLLWAYLPDQALEAAGITYYPDRYWAVALPAWWLVTVAFICLFNVAMNMYSTPLLSSMDNITDPFSNLHCGVADADAFCYEEVGGIPPVGDIPISLVNRCLYQ
ncbi:hypothetical protein LPJ61_001601 [Coemansia biformis]|uniref:PIG-P domain-containing protein n=1 Tax=Coemansia biformis TaxID=1286918 RepID=A0A9W8CX52_9FUNG|nr:hypothetical protein LPJ61_001601 [Coemansia biformis]